MTCGCRHRDPMPKYLRILLEGDWTPEPGELVTVEVGHDGNCAHRRGEACDCNRGPILYRLAAQPTPGRWTDDDDYLPSMLDAVWGPSGGRYGSRQD